MSASISGNAGIAGALVSWTGPSSGNVTADPEGNYLITGLGNGSYTITPSLAGQAFNPPNQVQTISGVNIAGLNFNATSASTPTSGFSASWFEGQQNAGLGVYVSAGQWQGVIYNPQIVFVPANSTSALYLNPGSGIVQVGAGASIPNGSYGIAIVVSGQVQTSGNGPTSLGTEVTSNGILSITDIRT
jgi:hypothetical protein